jgi:hypothetical protein
LDSTAESKPLTHSERGQIGARRRWGPQRVVRLAELDADTARLIRALLAQKQAVSTGENVETAKEVRRAFDARPSKV